MSRWDQARHVPRAQNNTPRRIVLLNDVGFIGGAGVALRRQAQSFLLAGHDVSVLCWLENAVTEPLPPRGGIFPGQWHGLHAKPDIHADRLGEGARLAEAIRDAVLQLNPEIVVAGNLHWARWPLAALEAIRAAGIPVVAYLHDCHWLTGRCAYFGDCRRFETHCNDECPTPSQYPPLAPELIAAAHEDRRRVFAGDDPLPMAANSNWTLDIARRSLGDRANVELLPLGLDMQQFAPFDKALARRMLGLPQDAFIVVAGAVDLGEPRKGGPLFRGVLDRLVHASGIHVVGFGHNSEYISGVQGLGNIPDERVMAVICNAADMMLSCATEESFGQSVLEAASCGRPAVAFAAGGISDIIRHEETGLLIQEPDPKQFEAAILRLATHRDAAAEMGRRARLAVADVMSLEAQAARWESYLARLAV